MKIINRGSANTVVFTLNEKCTLSSPVFLFRFINKMQHTETSCIASDTSTFKYRFNQFVITEDSTEDKENGTLELLPTGEWIYEVYEQSSSTNLDFTKALNILETGLLRVIGTATENTYNTGNTYTNKVYGTGA